MYEFAIGKADELITKAKGNDTTALQYTDAVQFSQPCINEGSRDVQRWAATLLQITTAMINLSTLRTGRKPNLAVVITLETMCAPMLIPVLPTKAQQMKTRIARA